jgi:hypothetical protein
MKKIVLGILSLSIVLLANNVTKEQAYKIGRSTAVSLNMKHDMNYEEKLKECERDIREAGVISADNRAEIIDEVIKGCTESIKK